MFDIRIPVVTAELSTYSGKVIEDVHHEEPAAVIDEGEARAIVAQQDAGFLERIIPARPLGNEAGVPPAEEIFILKIAENRDIDQNALSTELVGATPLFQ